MDIYMCVGKTVFASGAYVLYSHVGATSSIECVPMY